MASWHEVLSDAPEFAIVVQAVFDAYKHKVLATLRRDGAPRVSGNEARFLCINSRIVKAMGFDWWDQLEVAEGYVKK